MTEPRDEARDVLAEALHDLDNHAGREYRCSHDMDANELLSALAARGYHLVSEPAPDVEVGWDDVWQQATDELNRLERDWARLTGDYPGSTTVVPIREVRAALNAIAETCRLRAALTDPAEPR